MIIGVFFMNGYDAGLFQGSGNVLKCKDKLNSLSSLLTNWNMPSLIDFGLKRSGPEALFTPNRLIV